MSVRKTAPKAGKKVDARVERSRKSLQRAFIALFFERPYDRISVNAIAERAGVGRSTFYEHYVDKEDILGATVVVPMTGLAAAVSGGGLEALKGSLVHFRANAGQARALFLGTARKPLARVLAGMIAERLNGSERDVKIAAIAIAEAQVGAIGAWLFGEVDPTVNELADVLHRLARASALAVNPNRAPVAEPPR